MNVKEEIMSQKLDPNAVRILSDEELLKIIISDDFPRHEPKYHQAAIIERDMRSREREEKHQDALEKLGNQLLQVLKGIVEKPNRSAFFALLFAVAVGTLINVFTHYIIVVIDIVLHT